jgi:hypothetical protein
MISFGILAVVIYFIVTMILHIIPIKLTHM